MEVIITGSFLQQNWEYSGLTEQLRAGSGCDVFGLQGQNRAGPRDREGFSGERVGRADCEKPQRSSGPSSALWVGFEAQSNAAFALGSADPTTKSSGKAASAFQVPCARRSKL